MVNTVIYRDTHLSAEHGRYYRLKKAQHPPTRRSPPVTICVTISSPAVGAHQLPATRLPRRAQRGRGLMMRWDLLPCHSRWESRPQLQLNLSTRPCLKSLQTGNEDIGEAPRTENQTEVQGEHRKGFLYKTRCHKWWRACSSPHTLMPQVYPSTTQSIHVSRYKETRQSSRKTQFYFYIHSESRDFRYTKSLDVFIPRFPPLMLRKSHQGYYLFKDNHYHYRSSHASEDEICSLQTQSHILGITFSSFEDHRHGKLRSASLNQPLTLLLSPALPRNTDKYSGAPHHLSNDERINKIFD